MAGNVKKGWPLGCALEDSATFTDGAAIVAGMAVKKDASTGKLVKATGAAKEVAFHALDRQAASDVETSGKLPYIIGNAICTTDQFVAGTYTPGDELIVKGLVTGAEGKVKERSGATGEAAAPTYGWFDRFEVIEGVNQMVFIKPVPNGKAS